MTSHPPHRKYPSPIEAVAMDDLFGDEISLNSMQSSYVDDNDLKKRNYGYFHDDFINDDILYSYSYSESNNEEKINLRHSNNSSSSFFAGGNSSNIKTSDSNPNKNIWNVLNAALFISYTLSAMATSVPVTLVTAMSEDDDFFADDNNLEYYGGEHDYNNRLSSSTFAPRATASAVFGTACGNFVNGCVCDIFGARRTSVVYSILLSFSLLWLAFCPTPKVALWACFSVEFCQSVQWPCILVTLATHYNGSSTKQTTNNSKNNSTNSSNINANNSTDGGDCSDASNPTYEGGIYVTSLASRFGALVGIPLSSLLLRRTHWRMVASLGAWVALISSSVVYLFVTDSPTKINDPQNPIDPAVFTQQHHQKQQQYTPLPDFNAIHNNKQLSSNFPQSRTSIFRIIVEFFHIIRVVFQTNILPSVKHVLRSGNFWIVALAHTGSSMVRTSERILGTYFRDTSTGSLTDNRAGGLAVFLSFGTILGLTAASVIPGVAAKTRTNAISDNMKKRSIATNTINVTNTNTERRRKRFISRLYMLTIASCYVLAILAIPWLRYHINSPNIILSIQVVASFCMGFGIAVPFYQIPSLVGATFGRDKGLYASYTAGVAYGLASLVWRIVGDAVHGAGNPYGAGWAYGWAAVALLVILCAILMVEFIEHHFVRPSIVKNATKQGYNNSPLDDNTGGFYETIIFA